MEPGQARAGRASAGRSRARVSSPGCSVFENVEAGAVGAGLGRRAARARTDELLEAFALQDVAAKEARALSHGTARRLGVARALAGSPRFLLLDEPAAGLDEEESQELVELLKGVHREYSLGLVVIEHDVPLIMSLCERIHVLDHGETLAVGSPDEISRNASVIAAYLGGASQN